MASETNYGSPTGRYPCPVCEGLSSQPIFHRHHSTKYMYNQLLSKSKDDVDCLTCKVVHPVMLNEERVIIFFSTSTVHNVVLQPDIKSPNHFNVETICRGTIDMLRMNFSLLYYEESRPMDIILSAGLNDLDKTTYYIINELMLFKRNVLQQNPLKTFFVVKMLRPPKYCWFPRNGALPATVGHRTDHYVNKLEVVNVLNMVIDKMNKHLGYKNNVSFEFLGLRGSRKTNEKGEVVEEYEHMLERWSGLGVCLDSCSLDHSS